MPKEATKRFIYNQHRLQSSKTPSKNLYLEIEHIPKTEEPKCPLSWPAHVLVFGSTMAGKTTLISDILDNVELVYNFKNPHSKGKLIVVSPIQTLEIADKLSTFSSWDIELYHNVDLNEEFEEHLIKQFRLVPQDKVKILLLDDILTQSTHTQMIFLNRLFAYLRHEDISIIASVHAYDIKFSTIIDQVGLVVAMYCLNTSTVIRNILMRYLYKGTANVWRELRRNFLTTLSKHDYICLNFTKESLSSEVFFVTNSLFYITKGIKLFQIVSKM